MGGDAFPVKKAFHGRFGVADIHLLPDQLVRNAIKVSVNLDVVIDVDPSLYPLGVLIGCFRMRKHRRPVERLEA